MPKQFIFDKLSDKKKPFKDSPSGFKIRFKPYSDALSCERTTEHFLSVSVQS